MTLLDPIAHRTEWRITPDAFEFRPVLLQPVLLNGKILLTFMVMLVGSHIYFKMKNPIERPEEPIGRRVVIAKTADVEFLGMGRCDIANRRRCQLL